MKRLVKVLLVLVVLLLLVAGGALFGVHWWVQSEKGTARIQNELGKALGMPLEIRHAQLGWGGVRLTEVRIVQEGRIFLEAPAFSTEYQLAPLLHRQVVLRKMVLEEPRIVWPQTADGRWVLPARPKGPKSETPSAPKPASQKEFELALDTLEIKNGAVDMLDRNGERLARIEGVEIKASLATAGSVSAGVAAKSLALLENGPVLENVLLPFQYADGKLSFPNCEATLGGGTVRASASLQPKVANLPFDVKLELDKVELARAVTDPDWKIRSGQLQAKLALQGNSREFQRGTGRGEIHLTKASIDSLEPLLRLIGATCRIPELANLKLSLQSNVGTFAQTLGIPEIVSLREARAVFELKKKETVIEDLVVDGGDLAVSTKGTISAEGKLNLDANLMVSDDLAKKLPSFVRNSLTQSDPAVRRGIAFNITGKNDHPKTNLVDKVLGPQIGSQFTSIVDSIFGGRKNKEKDKDKDKDKDKPEEEKKDKEKKKKDKDKDKDKEKEKEKEMNKGDKKPAATEPTEAPAPPISSPAPAAPATAPREPAASN